MRSDRERFFDPVQFLRITVRFPAIDWQGRRSSISLDFGKRIFRIEVFQMELRIGSGRQNEAAAVAVHFIHVACNRRSAAEFHINDAPVITGYQDLEEILRIADRSGPAQQTVNCLDFSADQLDRVVKEMGTPVVELAAAAPPDRLPVVSPLEGENAVPYHVNFAQDP